MGVLTILLGLIILLTFAYLYSSMNPTVIQPRVIPLQQKPQLSIGTAQFPGSTSLNYYYDGWLRVDSTPNSTSNYVLFNRGTDFMVVLTGHTLSIVYGGRGTNIPAATVDPATGLLPPAPAGTQHVTVMTVATNFPFQKWTYFCFNVEGNTLDAYLDGKLVASLSKPLPNPNNGAQPLILTGFDNTSPIMVGSATITGGLANFRRNPGNMNPQLVWKQYMIGPGNTSDYGVMGPYHAKVAITQNGAEYKSLTLF